MRRPTGRDQRKSMRIPKGKIAQVKRLLEAGKRQRSMIRRFAIADRFAYAVMTMLPSG